MIHVTNHAILRYQERVAPVSPDAAREALTTPVIETAAKFGAHYVRLPGRQRVVLAGFDVITVLPAEHKTGLMSRERDRVYWERGE